MWNGRNNEVLPTCDFHWAARELKAGPTSAVLFLPDVKVRSTAAATREARKPLVRLQPRNPEPATYLLTMTAKIYRLIEAIHATSDRTSETMERLFAEFDATLVERDINLREHPIVG